MGKEFKDKVFIETEIHFGVWDRIKLLFCPRLDIKHELTLPKHEMPPYTVKFSMKSFSFVRLLKIKRAFKNNKGFAMSEKVDHGN